MIGELPKSVEVDGRRYAVRTDFRDILRILTAFNDPDLEDKEKIYVCLYIFYPDFDKLPRNRYEEAFKAVVQFIDKDSQPDKTPRPSPRIMDWEQDESIMFPAINKVAGFETRAARYVHWWTFLGYYMEITDGVFANVIGLRLKKAKGKKLEKWEREFWNSNKDLCFLKTKLSKEEQETKDRLNSMLG